MRGGTVGITTALCSAATVLVAVAKQYLCYEITPVFKYALVAMSVHSHSVNKFNGFSSSNTQWVPSQHSQGWQINRSITKYSKVLIPSFLRGNLKKIAEQFLFITIAKIPYFACIAGKIKKENRYIDTQWRKRDTLSLTNDS